VPRPSAHRRRSSGPAAVGAWIVGLLALAAVIGVVLRLSELEEVARLLRRIQPMWLLAALTLQSATYFCAAGVWQVALASAGYRVTTRSLVPLALAMLFTNQAVPSAGLSGSAIVLKALGRRGVTRSDAMAALLLGLVTTYAAYLIGAAASVGVLALLDLLSLVMLSVVALFVLGAVALAAAIIRYTTAASSARTRRRLARVPVLGPVLTALATAPAAGLRNPSVLRRAVALQSIEIVLDAATLFVTLVALGVSASPAGVFASFVMAYIVARVIPVPLGLGTFEGTSIGMLHLAGVGVEAALAATLLFRAYTLWLPMLPGLWCMRFVLADRRRWRTA